MVMVVKDVLEEVHNLKRIVLLAKELRIIVLNLLVETEQIPAVFQACLGATATAWEFSAT
jgi:hypothetical protein